MENQYNIFEKKVYHENVENNATKIKQVISNDIKSLCIYFYKGI